MLCVRCAVLRLYALIFHRRSSHGGLVVFVVALGFLGSSSAPAQETRREKPAQESAAALFERRCQRCHGKDGSGERDAGVTGIPDFRKSAWHARRTDAQLHVSIVDGRGDGMPAFGGRLNEAQVRALVAYIRALDPKPAVATTTMTEFETRFQELEREFQALQKELDRLSATPTEPGQVAPKSQRKEKPAAKSAALYLRFCQRCHGADGKGDSAGLEENAVPDFTNRDWHRERSDARLAKSILKGKSNAMPAFRQKLSDHELDELIEYIRAFGRRSPLPEATGESER